VSRLQETLNPKPFFFPSRLQETCKTSPWTSKLRRLETRYAHLRTRTPVQTQKHQYVDKLCLSHFHFFEPILFPCPFSLLQKPHKHRTRHTADPLYLVFPTRIRSRARCSSGVILPWHQSLSTSAQSKTASAPSQTSSAARPRPKYTCYVVDHVVQVTTYLCRLQLTSCYHCA
jgi:hypothetical protein